jgi:flagellar M-ring protein FliF
MAGFDDTLAQARQFWTSRSGPQKGLLLATGVGTIALLAVLVSVTVSPDYKPLFTGLEPADAQALAAQLDAEGIAHQTAPDGKTISVPADKLDAARLQTAAQGNPHSGRLGFELFDKMSWGQTEFDEKVTYQRALEGELEKTIQTLGNVESARVHLVMATDSVFLDHQRGAKASVVLKLRRNGLSKDSVVAISRLVAGAVDDLKPEDVSIVDADSDQSLGGAHDEVGNGEEEGALLSQRLISTLEPVVGADKIRATVNIDYDQGTTEENDERYDPSVSALLSEQKTEDHAGSSSIATGIPGTASNIPTKQAKTAVPSASRGPGQASMSETAQYGVNKQEIRTVVPAGRIRRVSAAILIDDAVVRSMEGGKVTFRKVKRSQDELAKINEIAEAVVGFDAKRGDVVTVQSLSFESPLAGTELLPPTFAQRTQKAVSDYSSLLKPMSLVILFVLAYLFVLRPVQKHALSPKRLIQVSHAALEASLDSEGPDTSPNELLKATVRATQIKDETIELIKQKPADTLRAVQSWLREEPS